MSTKFAIRNTAAKAEKEGDLILRFSGTSEPFRRASQREARKVGVDQTGDPLLVFTTGLEEEKVEFFNWFNDEEKKKVKDQIADLKPIITRRFGGEDVVKAGNKFFWGSDRDVSTLSLSNEDINVFYDTKNPIHALLYLSIISGGFMDLVAPTREWADRHQIPHYLALEEETDYEEDDEVTKSDAHFALGQLRKEESPEALFILAWCIQYDTNGYGAYTRATPTRDLVNYHIKYIDGKLQTKRKRNTPKVFLEYVEKWKSPQLRKDLFTEAYVKAGEWFNFINQRDKKYTTAEGTTLGNTVLEAVTNLNKAKFRQDYENLRDKVETKWKE